jgi:nucleotide-binding universal stress UspA family protein
VVKRILVTLDDSPFTDVAVRHSIELGKIHNAEVTGIAIIHVKKLENVGPVPIGGGYYAKKLRQFRLAKTITHVDQIISKFESTVSGSGIHYRVEREKGNPFRLLVSYASNQDLIITGLRSVFDYGVVNESKNLLYRMARAGVGPIFAVGTEFNPIHKVLVVYDKVMNSSSALKKLLQLQLWPDVSIRIVCFGGEDEKSRTLLLDATTDCSVQGFDAEIQFVEGPAKTQLFKHAKEWKTDLIVLGNSSRSFLARQVFGDAMVSAIQLSEKALFLAS